MAPPSRLCYHLKEIKSKDQKLCGLVTKLSGVLGSYISVYNDAVECMDQGVQVQKTKYVADIVLAVSKRIIEIKHQLSKLEQSNYQFISRGLADWKLTPLDTEFKNVPQKVVRQPVVQAAIDGVWKTAAELRLKYEEEERQRELKELEEHAIPKEDTDWWETEETKENLEEYIIEQKMEEIDEEAVEKRRFINMIIAQEKCRRITVRRIHENLKREHWEKVLSGLAKPEKRLEIRIRAATVIQKCARAYFALKRKKIADCKRDEILGLRMCKRPSDDAKIRGEEITETRKALREKYEEEWNIVYDKLKNKCFTEKSDEIQEDYRDELRSWFHKWYKEAWFFYDIPKPKQGGSILILKDEVPSPSEWKEHNQEYISKMNANKGKSSEQLKQEAKEAKQEARRVKKEEALKKKMEEKLLQKMMKNPKMHPGFKYPQSKNIEYIIEAIQSYRRNWDELDEYETVDVKTRFADDVDKNNIWAEVKLALRPNVDDDMRAELKKLKEALKEEYERLEEPWPDAIMPQKFPKIPKQKSPKNVISDKVVDYMIDLAMKEYLKEYPKTKFEDFKGEPNFAGDDLRCNFIHAMPFGGETRNFWWEKCRDFSLGFNRILLVGPKASGKTILAYAMATVNDAVLYELVIDFAHFGNTSSSELNDLTKSIIACAKATQPAIIYIKYVHRLFYSKVRHKARNTQKRWDADLARTSLSIPGDRKVPPEEPILDFQLLNKLLIKKLTKKFKKSDKVTVIGSCIDPWLIRSAQLLKLFPTVVMMPNTTYTTTRLILSEWVMNNRMVPPDLDVGCLAHVLQGYSFGYLQKALQNYLSAERIARMAAYGLKPQEIYDFILSDENETPVEYDKYLKWYTEKTHWGALEKKHLDAQLEYEALAKKYAEKEKKKKKGLASAASSAASSIKSN